MCLRVIHNLGLFILLVGCVPVTLVAGEKAARPEQGASIDDGRLRVRLGTQEGKLLELVDLTAQQNQAGDATDLGGLWEIQVTHEGKSLTLTPSQATSFRWQVIPAEQKVSLTWDGFTSLGDSACRIEATITLDAETPTSRWSIAISKPPGLALRQLSFPRLFGLRRQPNERLAIPVWMGQQMANPRSLLCPSGSRGRRLSWSYPGHLGLQLLAYYADGGTGLYAACDDTVALRKTFALWGTAEGQVHFETIHYPENRADGLSRYVLPYHVLLGTFQGDWITAAERYRSWARTQRWAQESRLTRGLVPDWLLDTGMWVWNRGRSPGVLPPAAALQERLGLPVRVFWHWWHGCPYDIGFPEYFPPREGTETFKRALAQAHQKGLRVLVYMNQRAWGTSTKSWLAEGAERFAVKGQDGKIRREVYNIFTKQALTPMCLATEFWRNKYAGLAQRAFDELGADGIYMDQACSQLPCYDPRHGHPPGGGKSWMEGFGALTSDIRRRCAGIALAGEGSGEPWLPHLDLMLTLQVSQERYSSPSNPWEVIPFFPAVYHQYALTYGSYSSLTMPPYDELWPAEFAPQEPLALLDRKYSRQLYLEQARAFVWGQQPALANFLPVHFQQRPEELEYIMRLARVRSRATKYLLHGEFLRPPQFAVPEATSDFSRLSIYAGQKSRLTSRPKQHPLALAGAWRAPDGSIGIALASIADETLPLSLTLDRPAYRLPARVQTYRIDEKSRQRVQLLNDNGKELKLQLPPREAWVIELVSGTKSGE